MPESTRAAIDVRSDPVGFLRECRDRYGDVFRYSAHVVVTSHPDDIHHVLSGPDRDRAGVPGIPGEVAGAGERSGDRLRARTIARRALKPAVLAGHLARVAGAIDEQLRAMSGVEVGSAAMAPFFVRAALPAAVRDPQVELVPAVVRASRAFTAASDPGRRVPRWLPDRYQRRADHAEKLVHDELRAYLAQHRPASTGCPHAVADELLDQDDPARGPVVERGLATTLMASAETPGAALAWTLYELGTRPQEFEALRAEACDLPAAMSRLARGREPAEVLPRAHAFVRETLRLHPPAWLMARTAATAARFGEHRVDPGHSVAFSPFLVHRDPRWWDSPDEFRPQRWLADRPPHAPRAYLPFGAGPRVCYGAHLGTAVLCWTVARIAAEYRLRLPGADQVEPRFGTPMRPANLRVRLDRRSAEALR